MNQDREYILFLGKSYGESLSRSEWDILNKDHPSGEIMRKLNLKKWEEYHELCGYETSPFTREDVIRYGKSLGVNISTVTRERWDQLISLLQLNNEQIPNSEDILYQFGNWSKFQMAVKTKPSIRKKEEKLMKKIEELFIEGCAIGTIAKRIEWGRNMTQEYLETVGLFTPEYVKEHFPNLEDITRKQIMNIKFYGGEDKKVVREIMLEHVKKLENSQKLRYCGLPGVNFIDYALFAKQYGIIPEESLAAESDKISGHVMSSLIRNWHCIKDGEIFRRLKLYLGTIEDALKEPKYKEMRFNVVNFDWIGGWAKDKQAALRSLFTQNHLADEALIFISLNDSAFERGRASSGRGYNLGHEGDDSHLAIAKKSLDYLAKRNKMEATELFAVPYRDTVEMLAAGYLVRRK